MRSPFRRRAPKPGPALPALRRELAARMDTDRHGAGGGYPAPSASATSPSRASALNTLDRLTKVLATVDGNDPQKTAADAGQLRAVIGQRTQFLATDEVITGS